MLSVGVGKCLDACRDGFWLVSVCALISVDGALGPCRDGFFVGVGKCFGRCC